MPEFYDVFLSHNSLDKPDVRDLRDRLTARGCVVFFDDQDLDPSQIVGSQIDETFEKTLVVAGCWGPNGVSKYHKFELDIAFNNAVQNEAILVTVILPGATPAAPTARFRGFPPIVFASTGDAAPLQKILKVVDRARADRNLPPRDDPEADPAAAPVRRAPVAAGAMQASAEDQTQQIVRQLRRDSRQFGMNFLLGPLTGIERPIVPLVQEENAIPSAQSGEPSPYELAHLLPDAQNPLPLAISGDMLSLQTVASWMTIQRNDPRLVQARLGNILSDRRMQNSAFYDRFASVMRRLLDSADHQRRRRTPPPLVFTTNYGTNLEWKLIQHGVPFSRITVKLPDTLEVQRISAQLDTETDTILLRDMNDEEGQPVFLKRTDPTSETQALGFLQFCFSDHIERASSLALRRVDMNDLGANTRPVTTRGLNFDDMEGVVLFKYHGSVDVDDSCVVNNEQLFELTRTDDLVPAAVEERLKIAPTVVFGSSFLLTEVQQAAEAVWRGPFNSKRINRYVVPRKSEGLTDRKQDGWLMQLEEGMRESLKTHAAKFNLTEVAPGQEDFLVALEKEFTPSPGGGLGGAPGAAEPVGAR